MMKFCRSLLTAVLAAGMLITAFAGCSGKTPDDKTLFGSNTSATSPDAPGSTAPDPAALLSENRYAAVSLEQAEQLISKYYNKRTHTVKTSLTDSNPAYIWPVASFLEALSEVYTLYPENKTVKDAYLDCLDNCLPTYRVDNATIRNVETGESFRGQTYYNASRGNAGDFYYDDNAWICIRFLTAYEQFGNEDYLTRAKEILEFLWTGWDEYQGGGIYWSSKFSDNGKSAKGICTNGPSCISHLWMYQITGESEYLERGKLLYEWVVSTLRDDKGIYFAGVGDPWQPAYDQGTMMYATVLLYEIEGEERYLELAKQSYTSVTAHMFTVSGNRKNPDVTMNRNPIYKSWCIGWLVRGMNKYFTVDPSGRTVFMKYLELVLDQTLETKDKNGQYDPFFCSPGKDFWDKDEYDTEVIMPAGVTSVLAQTGYFDAFLRGSNEKL
ncbi:MAG: glycoside hydrolase family 76 protein [Eubacteriales bacterium]